MQALLDELNAARGRDHDYDRQLDLVAAQLAGRAMVESDARLLVERLALLLQAGALLRTGSPVAEPFCRSRLGGAHGLAMGTLPAETDFALLIARALP